MANVENGSRNGNEGAPKVFERGSLPALQAQIAVEWGVTGISTKVAKTDGKNRAVQVTASPEGQKMLDLIALHPFTRALALLEEVDKSERESGKNGISGKEAHRLRGVVDTKKAKAAELLGVEDVLKLPHLGPDDTKRWIERAVGSVVHGANVKKAEDLQIFPSVDGFTL